MGPAVAAHAQLVCDACAAQGSELTRGCRACFLLLREQMLAAPHDEKRGYLFVTRADRRAAGLGDPRPFARLHETDGVKVSLLVTNLASETLVENPWLSHVRDEGDGWLSGEVESELRAFGPKVLAKGDRVSFRREHVLDVSPVVALAKRTDKHGCALCDPGAGPPRMPKPDDGSAKAIADVRAWGWHVVSIEEGEESPAFAYTLGAHHSLGVPDVLLSGLDEETAFPVLNRLLDRQRKGAALPVGAVLDDVFEDAKAMLVALDEGEGPEPVMTWTRWFYEAPSPKVQLVWADPAGRFPADAGFADWARASQMIELASPKKGKKRKKKGKTS